MYSLADFKILTLPDPLLRTKASPVEAVDSFIKQLMNDMLTFMYQEDGIGLAANQIGILKRIIVVDLGREYQDTPLMMANPEIISKSEDLNRVEEACLSVPNQWAAVYRPNHIKVRYIDENNTECEFETQGLMSSCLQHEIDHLNGILYVDHLSALKKRLLISRAVKDKKRSLH